MEHSLTTQVPPVEAFAHVRIIMGIVLGLCISRLLIGVARFIQHPDKYKVYLVHMAWVAFMLLSVIHFWWFEFNLRNIPSWNFETYLFIIFYACLHFMLCTLLFPENIEEYDGYEGYFISRRKWFFGLLALLFATDVYDTLLKGWDYFLLYGPEYPIRIAVFILVSLIAMRSSNRTFHIVIAVGALLYQGTFILRHISTLS